MTEKQWCRREMGVTQLNVVGLREPGTQRQRGETV